MQSRMIVRTIRVRKLAKSRESLQNQFRLRKFAQNAARESQNASRESMRKRKELAKEEPIMIRYWYVELRTILRYSKQA